MGVPLKPERWTEEMRACPHKREGDCVHAVAKITSVPEQPRHTHTRMSDSTHGAPRVAVPVLGDTDGCSDLENERDNRNGRTWGRRTRKENGESSLKRNINK